ncbi:hypothetical protein FQR65_LT04457 [Abscondita terminalis]|nr:hypothetical protein FQR65_LT04457 [Abscondita terminalis]
MKIAIIGAGVAGIVSLKYALEKGHECDCFEETGEFGGTWVYTDESGIDENGRKIYRTMYKDLITNLPKDVMVFMDFLYPQHINESYITQKQVLQYLTDYVTKFKLDSRIKFHQMVSKVRPLSDTKWNVTSTDLTNLTENSSQYDAVFVCSGHFRYPKFLNIKGQNLFSGIKMHSSEYRNPTIYQDKRVLLIGASYSAIDVANQIKNVTKSMFLSHWKPINFKLENVSNKPAVEEFHSKSAAFIDGTTEEIDIVIFCTGFEYKFPFLEEECGITVDDNCVRPLFKHIINIQHPTMFFIGIPFLVPAFLTCDLHVIIIWHYFSKQYRLFILGQIFFGGFGK